MAAMDEDLTGDSTGHCTTDAAGDRARHRPGRFDEPLADCRVRAATDLFAHTWDPVVLVGLGPGPLRRGDLLAAIGGVSDKVLTDTLRRLLANGLIGRHPRTATAPPHVDYALTPLGRSLVDGPLRELGRWSLAHGDALLAAQESADGFDGI
ncbi:winged helix-turn-helix transcriptional regulator [Actinacidiphila paucisporea]|uniref:Transcriptional regulator, HxlR family n=1 Tax=Actinacidiphila paucisporea TaxID=310782 RepID=A0A1M6ZB49_9ACTN|nr:helix-turn-helix domain-containing protein [Actinacidiphila paucisporea]SHL27650.1 transcriptional regulator, HxlR family [Actinacidiphila paucisporea]